MGARIGTAASVAALLLASEAHAAPEVPHDPNAPLKALQEQVDETLAALASSDCVTACRALASVRRAAEAICQLTPDSARCAAVRAKAEDLRRQVILACPECAVAAAPREKQDEKRVAEPAKPPPPTAEPTVVTQNAPERGGCASCHTPGTSFGGADASWLVVIAWALARLRRRRHPASS